jgi:hypothetical protein
MCRVSTRRLSINNTSSLLQSKWNKIMIYYYDLTEFWIYSNKNLPHIKCVKSQKLL